MDEHFKCPPAHRPSRCLIRLLFDKVLTAGWTGVTKLTCLINISCRRKLDEAPLPLSRSLYLTPLRSLIVGLTHVSANSHMLNKYPSSPFYYPR